MYTTLGFKVQHVKEVHAVCARVTLRCSSFRACLLAVEVHRSRAKSATNSSLGFLMDAPPQA
jgi:hypothetical protein